MKLVRLISCDGPGFRLSGTLSKRVGPGSPENEPLKIERMLEIMIRGGEERGGLEMRGKR